MDCVIFFNSENRFFYFVYIDIVFLCVLKETIKVKYAKIQFINVTGTPNNKYFQKNNINSTKKARIRLYRKQIEVDWSDKLMFNLW